MNGFFYLFLFLCDLLFELVFFWVLWVVVFFLWCFEVELLFCLDLFVCWDVDLVWIFDLLILFVLDDVFLLIELLVFLVLECLVLDFLLVFVLFLLLFLWMVEGEGCIDGLIICLILVVFNFLLWINVLVSDLSWFCLLLRRFKVFFVEFCRSCVIFLLIIFIVCLLNWCCWWILWFRNGFLFVSLKFIGLSWLFMF